MTRSLRIHRLRTRCILHHWRRIRGRAHHPSWCRGRGGWRYWQPHGRCMVDRLVMHPPWDGAGMWIRRWCMTHHRRMQRCIASGPWCITCSRSAIVHVWSLPVVRPRAILIGRRGIALLNWIHRKGRGHLLESLDHIKGAPKWGGCSSQRAGAMPVIGLRVLQRERQGGQIVCYTFERVHGRQMIFLRT